MAVEDNTATVLQDISQVSRSTRGVPREEFDERRATYRSPVAAHPATPTEAGQVTSVRLVGRNQSQRERRRSRLNEVAAWRALRDRGSSIG
ncbi:hypothetical protein ColTof3_07673 [Colletotrichum tofieldiae]|nr:hypothetical protein ColTof3_07673 [Colletotrichum tofieldiae]